MLDAKIICHRFVSDFRVKKIHLPELVAKQACSYFSYGEIRQYFPVCFSFKELYFSYYSFFKVCKSINLYSALLIFYISRIYVLPTNSG